MSIASVVLRGYGAAGVKFVPTMGYGTGGAPAVIYPGRLEFTLPSQRLEFTFSDSRLEFTLPKTSPEYAEMVN